MPLDQWVHVVRAGLPLSDTLATRTRVAHGLDAGALPHDHDERDEEHHHTGSHQQVADHVEVCPFDLKVEGERHDGADNEKKYSRSDTHYLCPLTCVVEISGGGSNVSRALVSA